MRNGLFFKIFLKLVYKILREISLKDITKFLFLNILYFCNWLHYCQKIFKMS